MRIKTKIGMRQPMAAPILRCRPDLVKGMPICRLILALAWEIPRNRFQENPPLFMIASFLPKFGTLPPYHKCSPKREHHYRLWGPIPLSPGIDESVPPDPYLNSPHRQLLWTVQYPPCR